MLAGCSGTQQDLERLVVGITVPPRQEMPDHGLAQTVGRDGAKIRQLQVEGRGSGEQAFFVAEIADDQRGIGIRLGRHRADRGAIVTLPRELTTRGIKNTGSGRVGTRLGQVVRMRLGRILGLNQLHDGNFVNDR